MVKKYKIFYKNDITNLPGGSEKSKKDREELNKMLIEQINEDTIKLEELIKEKSKFDNIHDFFQSIIDNKEIDININLNRHFKSLLKNKFLLYFINTLNFKNRNNLDYLNRYKNERPVTNLFWELTTNKNKKDYFIEILDKFKEFKNKFDQQKFIEIFGTDQDTYTIRRDRKGKKVGAHEEKKQGYGIYGGNNRLILLNNESKESEERRIYKENEVRIYKKNLFTLDSFDTPRDKKTDSYVGLGIEIDDKIGLIIDEISRYNYMDIIVEFNKNNKLKFKIFQISIDYIGDYELWDYDGNNYDVEILNKPSPVKVPVNEEYYKYDREKFDNKNLVWWSKKYLVPIKVNNQNIKTYEKEKLIGYKIKLPYNIYKEEILGIVINYQGQNIYQVRLPNKEVITVLLGDEFEVIKEDYYNIKHVKDGIQLLGYKIKFKEESDSKMQEGIVIDYIENFEIKKPDKYQVQQKNKVRWVKIERIYEWEDINNFWSTTKDSISEEKKLGENLIGSIIEFDNEKRLVLAYDNSTNRHKIDSINDKNWHSLESKKYKVLNIDIDNEKNDEDIIRIKGKVTNLIDNGLITYRQDSILPLPINKNELEITFSKSENSSEKIDLIGNKLIGHKIKLPNETLGIVIYYNPDKKIYKIRLPDKKEITSPLKSFDILYDYNNYSFSNYRMSKLNFERIGIRLLGYKISFKYKQNNKNGIIIDHKIEKKNHIYLIKSLDNDESLGIFKWYNINEISISACEDLGQFWSSTKETIIQELLQELRKKEKKKKELEEKEKENNKLYYYINDKIKNYKIDKLNLTKLCNLNKKLDDIIKFVNDNGVDFNNLEKISTDLLLGGTLNKSNEELLRNLNDLKKKVLNLREEKKKKLEDLFKKKIQKKQSDEIDTNIDEIDTNIDEIDTNIDEFDTNIDEFYNLSKQVEIDEISSSKSNNIRIQLKKKEKNSKEINNQINSINSLIYPNLENMDLQNLKNLSNKLEHIEEYLSSDNVIFEKIVIKLSILTNNNLSINEMKNFIVKDQSKLNDNVKNELLISINEYKKNVEIIINKKEQKEIDKKKQIEEKRNKRREISKKEIKLNIEKKK